jgi:hypothetical protein
MVHGIRVVVRLNRVMQAIDCVVAAVAFYAAIECFISSAIFLGIVCSVIGLSRFIEFDRGQHSIAGLRVIERRVREIDQELRVKDGSDLA